MYIILKTLITAGIIVGVSELAKRSTVAASLLLSLPLTSVLALSWIATMSTEIFWLVIPSLAFFVILPGLIKIGVKFMPAMTLAAISVAVLYWGGFALYRLVAGR